ncbi:MAG: hypothetical protein ACI9S8_001801 [Chlamydiales bacterium]|jgi:hypothetical protein
MSTAFLIFRNVVAFFITIFSYMVVLNLDSSPERFLMAGAVALVLATVFYMIFSTNRALYIFLFSVIFVSSVLGHLSLRPSKIDLLRFSIVPGKAYVKIRDEVPTFVEDPNSIKYPVILHPLILRIDLANPMKEAYWLDGVIFGVRKHESVRANRLTAERLLDKIVLIFSSEPSKERVQQLCEQHTLELENQYEEMVTFKALEDLGELDLQSIAREEDILIARPFKYPPLESLKKSHGYEAVYPLAPYTNGEFVKVDIEMEPGSHTALVISLPFNEAGKYEISSEISYDNKTVPLQDFVVFVGD